MSRFCKHGLTSNGLWILAALALLWAGLSACTAAGSPGAAPTDATAPASLTPAGAAMSTPSPTPTETPTATQTPAPSAQPPRGTATPTACADAMEMVLQLEPDVADASAPAAVPAGDVVRAGWRIMNAGSCIWDSAYLIQFAGPQNPGWINTSLPLRLAHSVRPGESLDIWVEALAPVAGGIQSAQWELVNGRGTRVGSPLTLTVESAALPTSAQGAARWFNVVPDSIQPGERAALSWSIQDAKAVYLDGPGVSGPMNPVETTASRYVFPKRTSKYVLEVVNGDDSVERLSVTVVVEDYLEPRIRTFEVKHSKNSPECFLLSWTTENRVNRVLVYRNGELIWEDFVDDGSIRDCPPAGDVIYVLEVFGPGGSDTMTRRVK